MRSLFEVSVNLVKIQLENFRYGVRGWESCHVSASFDSNKILSLVPFAVSILPARIYFKPCPEALITPQKVMRVSKRLLTNHFILAFLKWTVSALTLDMPINTNRV